MSWPSILGSEYRVAISYSLTTVCLIRRLAGIPDFIAGDDMDDMIKDGRLTGIKEMLTLFKKVFGFLNVSYMLLLNR